VKRKLSTAFHPQTDGLAEVTVGTIMTIVKAFANEVGKDWDLFLPLFEFAYNSSTSASTGKSPFLLNYGMEPAKPIDIELAGTPSVKAGTAEQTASAIARANEIAKVQVAKAQQRMKKYADKHRQDLQLEVGQRVLLSSENIAMPNLLGSYKFNDKWIGPFEVLAKESEYSYKVKLPSNINVHPVFHVSKLKPYNESLKFQGRKKRVDPTTGHGNVNPWIMEEILEEGIGHSGKIIYFVKWKDYPEDQSTWELATKVPQDLIDTWALTPKVYAQKPAARPRTRQRGR
jgi:hypothetical protein